MKLYHWIIIALIIAASFIAEFVLLAGYPKKHWWSYVPAFYGLLGFAGCFLLIIVAKSLGKFLVQKKEDYYDVR